MKHHAPIRPNAYPSNTQASAGDRGDTSSPFTRDRFRIPLATLRDWERGRPVADAVMAYLTVIEREPDMVASALAAG
jgi:hypothetical protein